MTNYFLFAGEASGDLHGSLLMKALKETSPSSLCGVGGPLMRQMGLKCLIEMEEFQVMGFSDVFKSLPRLLRLFYKTRNLILEFSPDCVILIDYPGFNLRLAKALRKHGYKGKIVQYICPTIWAHGIKRIKTLAENFDLVLSIFPFEKPYFSHTPLRVEYIGNPLMEKFQNHSYVKNWKMEMGLPSDRDLIALFPGSRQGEISQHVPQQLKAAASLKQNHPHLCFAISCAQESLKENLTRLVQQGPLSLNKDIYIVPPCYHYDLMKSCKTALAKSGTVTLELAIHGIPTIVHYELSTFNYLFAKYILRLKLPFYCIVNILSNKSIFPELIGRKISSIDLKGHLELLHFDFDQRKLIKEACENLKGLLGTTSSQQCAVNAIQEIMIKSV